jgi:hypothetical protein
MQLVWLRYQNEVNRKYILMLLLAEDGDKFIGVLSDVISHLEADRIIAARDDLHRMSCADRLKWLKENTNALKSGLRTVSKAHATVMRRLDVGKQRDLTVTAE